MPARNLVKNSRVFHDLTREQNPLARIAIAVPVTFEDVLERRPAASMASDEADFYRDPAGIRIEGSLCE
ncbi:MAG TPA: hypothetical protein VGG72_02035 [Bryobacteraceae bacterium]|jgi:hypothetical protein